MTSQFANMTLSSNFFDVVLFLLPGLVTSQYQYWLWSYDNFFYKRSEIPPSELCPLSGDWGELEIPNFARMSLYEMLLNAAKCEGYSFYHF